MDKTLIEKNKQNARNALKEAKERKSKEIAILRAKEKMAQKVLNQLDMGIGKEKGITYDF